MYIRSNKKHRPTLSLSESVGTDKDGNEITLMDIIPVKEESVFSRVETQVLWSKVVELIDTVLSKRESVVIKLRYGISAPRAYTQLEVADKMDISRSYVSRIEKRAVQKLSRAVNKGEKD